jgi:hypothetical protein
MMTVDMRKTTTPTTMISSVPSTRTNKYKFGCSILSLITTLKDDNEISAPAPTSPTIPISNGHSDNVVKTKSTTMDKEDSTLKIRVNMGEWTIGRNTKDRPRSGYSIPQCKDVESLKLLRAGIRKPTEDSIRRYNRERRLKRSLESSSEERKSKRPRSDGDAISLYHYDRLKTSGEKESDDTSKTDKRADFCKDILGVDYNAESIKLSFLLQLFTTDYFLKHEFVYKWAYIIYNGAESMAFKGDMDFVSLSPTVQTPMACNFTSQLASLLCFCFFSPFKIRAEPHCFLLFGEMDYSLYVDDCGYKKKRSGSFEENTDFPFINSSSSSLSSSSFSSLSHRSSERTETATERVYHLANRDRYASLLKDVHKNTYMDYASLNDTCIIFLYTLFNVENDCLRQLEANSPIKNDSRFKKFLVYGVMTEYLKTYRSLWYESTSKLSASKKVESRHIYVYERMADKKTIEAFVAALFHFKDTFKFVMLKTQTDFFDKLIYDAPEDNYEEYVDHLQYTFYTHWAW